MKQRLAPITALVCGLAALVVCLGFGSETYIRKVVVERRFGGEPEVWAQILATPDWSRFSAQPGTGGFFRYGFLLVFPILVAVLILALTRGANGFVAGWTAAVAAGAVAGFVRGLALDDRFGLYGGPRGTRSATAFALAGRGASFGLLIGWGIGIIAVVGGLLGARSSAVPPQRSGGEYRGQGGPGWAPPPPPPGQVPARTSTSPADLRGDDQPPVAPWTDPAVPDAQGRVPPAPPSPGPRGDESSPAGPLGVDDETRRVPQVGDTPPDQR